MFKVGLYDHEEAFSLHSAPLFVTFAYNISISLALYGLALFYICTKKLLESQRPLMKFVSVKGIILVSYWQNLLIAILAQHGVLDHPGALQALLTAIETIPAAILVASAFPVGPYRNVSADASPLDPAGFKQISGSSFFEISQDSEILRVTGNPIRSANYVPFLFRSSKIFVICPCRFSFSSGMGPSGSW